MQKFITKNTAIWATGSILILMGISMLGQYFLASLFLTIAGFLVIPPTFNFINTKVKNKITNRIRVFIVIVLFLLGSLFSSPPKDYNSQQQDKLAKIPSPVKKDEKPLPGVNTGVNTIVDSIQQEKGTVVSITDGDTLKVRLNDKEIVVRLIGIDTPEISHQSEPIQCYGPEAKEALQSLILNKEVILEKDISDKDKYDRYLRYIWLGEQMINETMVIQGYAFSSKYPPDTKYQKRLEAAEILAKKEFVGLWAIETCNGDVYTNTYKDPNKLPKANVEEILPITPVIPPPYLEPVVSSPPITNTENSKKYICNCSKSCGKMAGCDEAYFQLNNCGCSARDGDDDGVPCESICN